MRAIRTVARGHRYLSEFIADALADKLDKPAAERPHELLSEREFHRGRPDSRRISRRSCICR
ncbi:MAG: DNA-binding response regulator, LuxR family [uncultured Caballeronia sp.]|nr:MAG: DNA-binding response regulator, LuxR family [uncultured Caballeronia sp.]